MIIIGCPKPGGVQEYFTQPADSPRLEQPEIGPVFQGQLGPFSMRVAPSSGAEVMPSGSGTLMEAAADLSRSHLVPDSQCVPIIDIVCPVNVR